MFHIQYHQNMIAVSGYTKMCFNLCFWIIQCSSLEYTHNELQSSISQSFEHTREQEPTY